VAGSRAMTWMIGFRLNENSNLRCGMRMLANKRSIRRLQRSRANPRVKSRDVERPNLDFA
jgi:hypothetical protein